MRKTATGLTLMATVLAASSVSAEGTWKYSSGFDYSRGDYGGDPVDTKISAVPFTVSYKTTNWTFKGSTSWLEIEGDGRVIGGGDGGIVLGNEERGNANNNGRGNGNSGGNSSGNTGEDPVETQPVSSTESGMGDVWLSATYAVPPLPSELGYLDLTGKIKLPTADEEDGLGTGETDYTLQADYFKPLGKFTPYATLAYKIKGDPSGVDLKNVFYTSVGSGYRVSEDANVGLSLDFQQAATTYGDDSLELFGYWTQKLNSQWSATVYAYLGLADGSPDQGLGLQLSFRP